MMPEVSELDFLDKYQESTRADVVVGFPIIAICYVVDAVPYVRLIIFPFVSLFFG